MFGTPSFFDFDYLRVCAAPSTREGVVFDFDYLYAGTFPGMVRSLFISGFPTPSTTPSTSIFTLFPNISGIPSNGLPLFFCSLSII